MICEKCSGEEPASTMQVGEEVLIVSDVEAIVGPRQLCGPLIICRDGIFLFIERVFDKPDVERSLFMSGLNWFLGLVSGKVLEAAMRLAEEKIGLPSGVEPRDKFSFYYDKILAENPRIVRCRWCLPMRPDMIRRIEFHGSDILVLKTTERKIDIRGPFAEAPAYMSRHGYSVIRKGGYGARYFSWRLTGALVVLLTLGAGLGEMFELRVAGEWLAPKVGDAYMKYSTTQEDPVRRIVVRDGKRYWLMRATGQEIREDLVPEEIKRQRKNRGAAEFVFLLVGMCSVGFLAIWGIIKSRGF